MKSILSFIFSILLFSNTSHSQWTLSQTGGIQPYYSISAVNDNVIWTGGEYGTVARTINGGSTWSLSIVGDSLFIVNVFGIDEDNALVITNEFLPNISKIWKTSNGGNNWVQVFQQTGDHIRVLKISSSGTGLCIGDAIGGRWSIIKTTDFGTSWDTTGMFLAGSGGVAQNMMFYDGPEYWFGASGGRLFHTTNDGGSWTVDTITSPSQQISGIWFNGQFGLVSSSQEMYRTTNGGSTWDSVSHPVPGFVVPAVGIGNKMWLITRGSEYIYSSTDNGLSWTSFSSLPKKLDITLSRTGGTIWIASIGAVLHNSTGVNISTISNQVPDGFSLQQNYPNPFNPSTKIKFAIPNSSFVKLAVYDMLGREVSSLVNQQLQPGAYEYEFDASDLNSGVYFYKLESNSFTETKKMLLIK